MDTARKIKIAQVFDGYSEFYQPYIPPVIEGLKQQQELTVNVFAFKQGNTPDVTYIPSYYRRKFKEKFYNLFRGGTVKLTYAEIVFLKKNYDVVHLQHSYLFPKVFGLLKLPKHDRPKIVITLRGGDTYVKPWIQEKWQSFYREKAKHVDAFVVMSNHQKNYLHEKWGVALDRIHIAPISFGKKFTSEPKYPAVDTLTIVSVFRMCWEKNIDGNLRIVKALVDRGLPIFYHLYGSGPDAGQIPFLIDKYELSKHVTYHGRLANNLLKEELKKADIFLQLSHSEAFPTTVIEAQSFGIPALVSKAGGLPEAIVPNKSGYCIYTSQIEVGAEYIEKLWKNKDMYFNFSEAAIKHAQANFSVDDEVHRLAQLYKTLTL